PMRATPTLARRRMHETAGGFHRSWFPLALASDLGPGQVIGGDVLGTRVVCYRDAAGRAVVQGAYCPHLGADLSVGQVIDGQIRCAYHHRGFGGPGRCVDIPAGDRIPPAARVPTYPSAEAWGLVWAFNGPTPDFDPPRIPGAAERELVLETHFRGLRDVDPWVATSNGVDFQHLRTLHGLPAVDPDAVRVGEHHIEYRIESSAFVREGRRGGDAVAEKLASVGRLVRQLIAEDAPVLDTIRFRPGVLVASDRHLARFFQYVRRFPRAQPPSARPCR